MSYAQSADAELRRGAYQELLRVYAEHSKILAQMYSNRVRDWHAEFIELRGYASPIAVRNVANDVPDAAVDTLLEVSRRNAPLFHRYFAAKAKLLGTKRLRRYDLYAPLTGESVEIPYDEGARLVLDTFDSFDATFGAHARRVFEERHLDSEVRRGKKGGAFCATVLPRLTPWVLLSYTGKLRDVSTLAHELGHAVHSMLAAHHSVLTQQPTLPLAETASVFAEMLVRERLLADYEEPEERRALLAEALDDIYATVLRQAFFVLFERAAHEAILDGKSPEQLGDLYMENLAEQFGSGVELPAELRYEWLAIPHIFSVPFYCYAYSFGQLLVLALYRRYQVEGEAFKRDYIRLLAHGGAERPQRVLAEAGVDLSQESFWQGGFDIVADLIDQLESLL
jgi:oligoendopeptidase F